jgi:hypothetical protein
VWPLAVVLLAGACGDGQPLAPAPAPAEALPVLKVLECTANVVSATLSCSRGAPQGGPNLTIIGGQNDLLTLASSNVSASNGIFQFDVTVQNLMPEAMGTWNGVVADTAGIRVFFYRGPSSATGVVTVDNEDGAGVFTGPAQPFFRYSQILHQNDVSSARTWRLAYGAGVQTFTFRVYVAAAVQPLLVINEVMVNPSGTMYDLEGDWFEVYNAGRLAVQMEGMLVADSAASGRQAYHRISAPLEVPPGGYVVLGNSTSFNANGGVPVDYAYGSAMRFPASLDALKISRLTSVAGDTVTVDRTQYAQASVSAQDGVSRELKNPGLDNANMDGSNWAAALVTAVFGSGGRGTPKAQNSTYTP